MGDVEGAIRKARPVLWVNSQRSTKPHSEVLPGLALTAHDMAAATQRWQRLAPLLKSVFGAPDGVMASELREIPGFRTRLASQGGELPGRVFAKLDSDLPVCGSIKARGGLYETLAFAEATALRECGDVFSQTSDYSLLATHPLITQTLQCHRIAVGSTGNLGMSVGLAASKLGMQSVIHMSTDAKEWKKQMLRAAGCQVREHAGDYGLAVLAGRKESDADPSSHFVDDESSTTLFLGYACAAYELKQQLDSLGVVVDSTRPLVVYIPCGVGGAPGGIAWGLTHVFPDDSLRILFAEPTQAPCVTVGLMTGLHEGVSVADYGLTTKTQADGLAVGRASGMSCRMIDRLIAGCFTVEDETMFKYLRHLWDAEHLFVEPSCAAVFAGPQILRASGVPEMVALADHPDATHIFWMTGGSLVPQSVRDELLATA